MNVAGTRAFTEPPARLLAPPGGSPPLTDAPPVPGGAVEPDGAVEPGAAIEPGGVVGLEWVVELDGVVELVGDLAVFDCAEDAAAEEVAEPVWLDPPHAAIATQMGTIADTAMRRFTFSA